MVTSKHLKVGTRDGAETDRKINWSSVKTMSNSGQLSSYSSHITALQLNSGPLRITLDLDTHIPFW